MPVSKRDKKVSLTKTTKKGMINKHKIVDKIRESVEKYNNLFVFSAQSMRNGPLNEVREKWRGTGRFFFAKRRLMSIALGRSSENEVKKNLHKISSLLQGEYGLFLTNKPKEEVVQWFESYSKLDYARAGFIATETVELPEGPLPSFAASMENRLRELGMPTQLEKGVIVLRENYTVCTKGSNLTRQQAEILKLLKKELAEFKLILIGAWSKDGTFETFQAGKEFKSPKSTTTKKEKKTQNLIKKEESDYNSDINMDVEEGDVKEEDVKEKEKVFQQKETPKNKRVQQKKSNHTPDGAPNQVDAMIEQENDTCDVTPNQYIKTPNQTPKQSNKTASQTPKQSNKTPSQTPKQSNKTPNLTPKQNNKTPNQTPKQSKKSPDQAPEQNKMPETAQNLDGKISKTESPKKQGKSLLKLEESSQESEMTEDTQSEFDDVESLQTEPSPKLGKANPRRSMRTPKPLKRTPEQRRLSVKKLTDPAGRKGTPKGTPSKATSARKTRLSQMPE